MARSQWRWMHQRSAFWLTSSGAKHLRCLLTLFELVRGMQKKCRRFVCDHFDGTAARALDQCSTLGAVLDMVTDRCFSSSSMPEGVAVKLRSQLSHSPVGQAGGLCTPCCLPWHVQHQAQQRLSRLRQLACPCWCNSRSFAATVRHRSVCAGSRPLACLCCLESCTATGSWSLCC